MTDAPEALKLVQTRRRCDPSTLGFETTAELEPLSMMLGQSRAEEAIRFGISMRRRGFNVFVLGSPGMGKHRLVSRLLETRAASSDVADDWAYVFRFDEPDRPRAIRLPAGRGSALSRRMDALTEDLGPAIGAAFETDEFRNRRRIIEQEVEARHEEAFSVLAEAAEEQGLKLLRTPNGVALAPVKDGKVLEPQDFSQLEQEERDGYRERLSAMEAELREITREVPKWQREARERLSELQREMAKLAAADQLAEAAAEFADLPEVVEWLGQVQADIVEHASAFLASEEEEEDEGEAALQKALMRGGLNPLSRYRVNLFIDRTGEKGAPVVYEDHPTLERLVGKIEQRAHLGALVSDFTLIKSGSLHRANGGYLVLDARRLLNTPGAYDALERALRRGGLEIETLGRAMGMSTGSLDPDPIPLDLKVVLIGERGLYYRLRELDPDFDQLFRVMADFEDDIPWDAEHEADLARLVASVARDEKLLPFTSDAVAWLIEYASRLADDQRRLTTQLSRMCDVLREADWRARDAEVERVGADHVRESIAARRSREGRVGERLLERFDDGTMLLDTTGEVVGQINGLSVLSIGGTRFGQPNRITSTVRLGAGEVVDIEREVLLGGPIHSKGVLILSSYLGSRYDARRPLSLTASLVFEQSYGGVDGDSASLAELCALLSAIGEVPIKQSFALTGSVNQRGQVQAIGGVNEKIEGFFDVCAARGLDGTNAVIIPPANVPNLMLREDVVEAIEAGRFAVYAARDVDEALALLTGMPVGAANDRGVFPEDSVHGRVDRRLAAFADRAMELAQLANGVEK